MIGMILCGGYGKRFYPTTEEIPKSLFELKPGYSILDRQLFMYENAGFDRVLLLTGHLSEKIKQRYGNRYGDLKLEYLREEQPLGTLNAIRMGMEAARDDAMVNNGDIVADLNLKRMIQRFKSSGAKASMFITQMRSPYGIVEVGERYIRSFREKPLLDYFINGGFYCLSKELLPQLQEFRVGDVEKTLFPRLAEQEQLTYYKENGCFWASVDTSKDLEEVKREYENRVDKPWGYEKLLVNTPKHLAKELFILGGYRTPVHCHQKKDETLQVVRGSGYVKLDGKREDFKRSSSIRIKPGVKHSIVAVENTLIREVSAPFPEDVVRVRDFHPAG